MNAQRKTNGFGTLAVAIAILAFAAFLATAEAQTQGSPDTNANADDVKTPGETPMFPCMDEEFFKSLDANNDGVLSRDEMPARSRFGRRGMGRRGAGWLDANNDGVLSRDEMPARSRFGRRGMGRRGAGWLDANNDGALSRDEMPARSRFGRRGMGRRGAGWLDKSGDDAGSGGSNAFVPPCMDEDYFKRLDANNDGALSRDELPARPRFGRRGMGRQ